MTHTVVQHKRDENLRRPLEGVFKKPILFSIVFSLICKTALCTAAIYISQDEYYGIYYLSLIFIEFIVDLALPIISANRSQWTKDDFELSVAVDLWITCGICYKGSRSKRLPIAKWRVAMFWIWFAGLLSWLYPLGLYTSVLGLDTGFGVSLAGKSSCQSDRQAEGTYNPEGAFPHDAWREYDSSLAVYTFCPLDQQWAGPNPTDNYIQGYSYYFSTYDINCQDPITPGYVGLCPDAFPDQSLGIPGPIVDGTSTTSTELCPGNTPLPACFNSNNELIECNYCTEGDIPGQCFNALGRRISCSLCTATTIPGRPLRICPVCLNYYRMMSGDHLGPGDYYRHCPPYNPNEAMNVFCYFCPGRGHGWHPNAAWRTHDLVTVFWIMTTSALFVPFIDFLIFTIWLSQLNKKYIIIERKLQQ